MKVLNYTKNRILYLLVPVAIIIAGIVMYFVHGGFNFDIEFMGGIRMQVNMNASFDNDEVVSLIKEKNDLTVTVQKSGDGTQAIIKTEDIEEQKKDEIFATLKEAYSLPDDAPMSVSSASASFGQETQRKAFLFTFIAIVCILAYIAIRFEVRSAVMAVLALLINVLVMLGVYAITNIPLNTTFIAAMLTVVGYSINNTIVIFDRIRENAKSIRAKKGQTYTDMVDRSISESMGRTINSTLTTLITIVLLYFIGVAAIKEFALPLIIGILAGAYTSIFFAGPFWGVWKEADRKAKEEAARAGKAKKK